MQVARLRTSALRSKHVSLGPSGTRPFSELLSLPRHSSGAPASVAFVTDVEGNANYLWRCTELSPVLCRGTDGLAFKDKSSCMVFGGDAVDHGPGDIQVSRELVRFKQQAPGRVFLLAGNRDVNKLRLASELEPLWRDRRDEAPAQLQHILSKTMGAVNAFEHRRAELGGDATDMQVTESFVEGIQAGGYMREYLESAQLAACVGDTVFVHGAIPPSGLGFVPGYKEREVDVETWVDRLNEYYVSSLKRWIENPLERCELVEYGRPGGAQGKTVIYNDWLQADNLPRALPESLVNFLGASGFSRVVSGHRPHGDSPLIIRSRGLTVISADTSYSNKSAADLRGNVAAAVTIDFGMRGSSVRLNGERSDGTKYEFVLEEEDLVGLPYRDPSSGATGWIKACLDDGSFVVAFSKGEGSFSSELIYKIIPKGGL